MTGLYVICSERPQEHLSKRRYDGYQKFTCGNIFAYAQEENGRSALGVAEGEKIKMLPQWIEDVRSIRDDPRASFFYLVMKNRESVEQAIDRGCSLPLSKKTSTLLAPDQERRLVSDA